VKAGKHGGKTHDIQLPRKASILERSKASE
jgi:hypothetical protein